MPTARKSSIYRSIALVLGFACAGTIRAEPAPVRLVAVRHEIGAPSVNRNLTGGTLRVGSHEFAEGLCVQAPARIELALGDRCTRFTSQVGVDLAPRQRGEVSFVVLGDGREVYRSELLAQGDEPVAVSVPLDAVERLTLIVEEAGLVVGDMADWAEPALVLRDGSRLSLSEALAAQGFPPKREDLPPRAGALVCNVRDFGAVGDGLADDTSAFRDALARLAAAAQGVLYLPPGDYRLTKRVELVLRRSTTDRSGLTVRGEGQGVSNLLCDSPEGCLRLTDPAAVTQFNLHDFSVVAKRPNCGTALDLALPGRGARSYRTLILANVDLRGDDPSAPHYFTTGVEASGHWRPLLRNVVVRTSPARQQDGTANTQVSGECGIRLDWCYAPALDHCYVWGARTGYSLVSRHASEGPEDGSFIRCTAVRCGIGLEVDTPIPEPQLVVTACHFNCTQVGVRLRNRKFFSLTDNLFYSAVPSETPYTDVVVTGRAHCGVIANNFFHFSGRDVYRAAPPSKRVNIEVDSEVRDLEVTGNVFNAKGQTVTVAGGARRINTEGNHLSNAHARPPVVSEDRPAQPE